MQNKSSGSKAKYFDLQFTAFPYDRSKAENQIRATKTKGAGDLMLLFAQVADKYERMMATMNYCKDEGIEMIDDVLNEIPEIAGASKTKLLTALEGGDAEKMRTEFNKNIEIYNDGFERLCHSMGQDYCQRIF